MKEFDFSELENFIKNWNEVSTDFEIWLKTFLLQQAQRVVAQAKENTPVDTGALRASWSIGSEAKLLVYNDKGQVTGESFDSAFAKRASIQDIKVTGNNLEVTIFNPMEYASYIEFGFSKRDGAWYEGKMMLTLSIDSVSRAMPSRFNNEFKIWLKSKGAV